MEVGRIIMELRIEKGIYQKELATYLKVSIGTISNYEKGVHFPDLTSLCKLADYFGVTTDYLLGRTEYRSNPDTLNQLITKDYTIANLINTSLSLSPKDANALVDYIELLKLRQNTNDTKD